MVFLRGKRGWMVNRDAQDVSFQCNYKRDILGMTK